LAPFRIFPTGFWRFFDRWEYYQRDSGILIGVGNIPNGIPATGLALGIFPTPLGKLK